MVVKDSQSPTNVIETWSQDMTCMYYMCAGNIVATIESVLRHYKILKF